MKICPHCKAELDDNARFCLSCMTSLDQKEQIPPPVRHGRRWPWVFLCFLFAGLLAGLVFLLWCRAPEAPAETAQPTDSLLPTETLPSTADPDPSLRTYTADGVRYTFRPATEAEHPTVLRQNNYFTLIRVEGTPADGIYRVPSFLGDDLGALVTAIAEGAFAGTDARIIDLGYNVRFVWGNAFGDLPLTDLYLHNDVRIDRTAFSGCTNELTIHCPDYLENTEGVLWSVLADQYGFRWQPEPL